MTLGDDCLAIKGVSLLLDCAPVSYAQTERTQNSTNIYARNITCHGGNGIAIGSLGQYSDLVGVERST